MAKIKITLKKSLIGRKPNQRDTVRSLGLKKVNHSIEKELSPSIEGMVKTVSHLIEVEEVK